MQLTDPARFFGIDSGMRRIVVSARERAVLERAASIVETAHDLAEAELGDGHYDLGDGGDLCLVGPGLLALARGEVEW